MQSNGLYMKNCMDESAAMRTVHYRILATVLTVIFTANAGAEPFFSDQNPFTALNDPIPIGIERFSSRLDAVRGEREPIGLVLSGGSARALAHIGVLAVLEEAGIRPDFIVANSMGAIVALLYAAGYSPEAIGTLLEGTSLSALFEPVFPLRGGLLDARSFEAAMRALTGFGLDLADLAIPVIITCEDLRSRRQVLLAEGDFAQVMRAAFALPAFFEPVEFRGLTLIDGGVTNLVPAALAYRFTSRVVTVTALYDPDLSFNNPLVVLSRAIDIGKTRQAISELEEYRPVVIRCEVEDLSFMAFDRPAELIGRGRASAERALREVLELTAGNVPPQLPGELRERRGLEVERFLAGRRRGAVDRRPSPELSAVPLLRLVDRVEGGSPFAHGERYAGAGLSLAAGRSRAEAGLLAFFGDSDGAEERTGFPLGGRLAVRSAPLSAAVITAEVTAATRAPAFDRFGLLASAGIVSVLYGPSRAAFSAALWAEGHAALDDGRPIGWEAAGGFGVYPDRPNPAPAVRFELDQEITAGWRIDMQGNGGPVWNVKLNGGLPGVIELRSRSAGRWTVTGPGTLLRESDGYRGKVESAEAPAEPSAVCAVLNLELAFGSGTMLLDFAELSVIRAVSLGLYFDSAVRGAAFDTLRFSNTAGLSLSVDVSFLGLAPVSLSSYIGVAIDSGSVSFGIGTGRFFPR